MRVIVLISFLISFSFAEIVLTGSVVSNNQKMITSRYMGYVKNIYVSEGDRVKKGQLLYEIDSKEIDSAKRQLQLALQMHENQYINVKLNLDRHKRLYEKDMVSKYELENLQLAEKNLKNMVEITKAQLAEVKNQYKYLNIKSPTEAVVVAKNVNQSEMAMPGMPAIVLSDLKDLSIVTEIAESDLDKIKAKQVVTVEIPSLDFKKESMIEAIIPSSNPMTHKFKVKVKLDYEGIDIYPGMYAKVIIK